MLKAKCDNSEKSIKFSQVEKMETEKSDMKILRVFRGGKWIFKNLNSHYRRKRQSERKNFQNELIYGNYFSRILEVKYFLTQLPLKAFSLRRKKENEIQS